MGMDTRSGVLVALTLAVLVFVSGVSWYGLRAAADASDENTRELAAHLVRWEKELARLTQRLGVSSRSVLDVRSQLANLATRISDPTPIPRFSSEPHEEPVEEATVDDAAELEQVDLPPLPKGVRPSSLLHDFRKSTNLSAILANPAINPLGKTPDYVQKVELVRELTRANAQLDILNGDLQLDLAHAREILKADEAYVDYAPGEEHLMEKGVVTFGQMTERGLMRVYYMYPEEFPRIYELRQSRGKVAEEAIRRVIAVLQ